MADPLANSNAFSPVISKAVEESATAFFSGSCGLTHVPEAPAEKGGPTAGIMSSISFMGGDPWSFALALPEAGAVQIVKAFAGFDIPFDSPDMGDALGEIVNVIAGDITRRLSKQGITANMSLPTTIRGDNVAILVPSVATATRFTYSGPEGTCWFNLVGTPTGALTSAPAPPKAAPAPPPAPAPVVPKVAAAPPPAPPRPSPSKPPASEPAPSGPSAAALAAWAAAEAEAERELAEQDALEAAQRAAGGPPPTVQPAAPVARPVAPVARPSRRLLYLTIVFACGGWGAAAGVLASARHKAKALHSAHETGTEAAPKMSVADLDNLIRSGKFTEGLKLCLNVPKDAPGWGDAPFALREGLCLEGTGQWVEAARAYQKADAHPNVAAAAVALLGQARCAAHDESYEQARALSNRVLLRSGHPDCRGLKVREEARYLRSRIAELQSDGPPEAGARFSLSTSANNCLDWLAAPAVPPAAAGREVLEIHRTMDAPGALQITAGLAPRSMIAVLRAVGTTAGWKVQAADPVVALLNLPVGHLDVDHMPLPEFLDVLMEGTGIAWAIRGDALVLTPRGREEKARSE